MVKTHLSNLSQGVSDKCDSSRVGSDGPGRPSAATEKEGSNGPAIEHHFNQGRHEPQNQPLNIRTGAGRFSEQQKGACGKAQSIAHALLLVR